MLLLFQLAKCRSHCSGRLTFIAVASGEEGQVFGSQAPRVPGNTVGSNTRAFGTAPATPSPKLGSCLNKAIANP